MTFCTHGNDGRDTPAPITAPSRRHLPPHRSVPLRLAAPTLHYAMLWSGASHSNSIALPKVAARCGEPPRPTRRGGNYPHHPAAPSSTSDSSRDSAALTTTATTTWRQGPSPEDWHAPPRLAPPMNAGIEHQRKVPLRSMPQGRVNILPHQGGTHLRCDESALPRHGTEEGQHQARQQQRTQAITPSGAVPLPPVHRPAGSMGCFAHESRGTPGSPFPSLPGSQGAPAGA